MIGQVLYKKVRVGLVSLTFEHMNIYEYEPRDQKNVEYIMNSKMSHK